MKILLAGYEEMFRAGLRLLLENFRENIEFVEVKTFEELVAQCNDGKCHDLILMDPIHPGWLGADKIRIMRVLQPSTALVILSVREKLCDIREALDHGVNAYIPKSSSFTLLKAILDLVLSGGVYVPPLILDESAEQPQVKRPSREGNKHYGSSGLTPRQLDVLSALHTGQSNRQIAHELGISEGTVKIHLTAIFKLLDVRNRTQAAMVDFDGAVVQGGL